MKILSIGLDKWLWKKDSKTLKRIKEYSQMVDETHIVVHTPKWFSPKKIWTNIFLYPTNSPSKLTFIRDAFRVAKKIIETKKLKPQNTIITTQDPFETGVVGVLLKKKFKLGLNIQDHGNFFESKYRKKETILNLFRYQIGKIILRMVDSIRVVSQKEQIFLKNKNHRNIIKVPVFTCIPPHLPEYKEKNEKAFTILMLSRLVKQKNIPFAIKSLEKTLKENSNITLKIVGKGPEKKKIINLVHKLWLKKSVVFEDRTNNIAKEYLNANVFLLSSNYEGWGRTVIEAAIYNLPVIMTDTGCAWDFLIDGYNGIVTEINNKKELEKAITKMYENSKFRITCTQNNTPQLHKLPNKEETLDLYMKSWELALAK